jgi:hypothetical protein
MAYSIPDWLRSLYGPQAQTGTPMTVDPTYTPQTTGWTTGPTGGLIPVQPKAATVNPPKTTTVGGFAQRVQELQNAGWDYDAAVEMASTELENEQFYADLLKGTGSDGTAAAQISADAARDVARMQVDGDKYAADLTYRAAVDVAARQVDSNKYVADMAYRQAVDAARISADASRDVERMDVDARRYEADATYRQSVDVAQIQAYSAEKIAAGTLGLGYYQTLAEMQKNPADWVSYWYATQGEKLPEGYKGAGVPEGLQLPAWLQGLNEQADYTPTTWKAPVPEVGAAPKLLGSPEWQPTATAPVVDETARARARYASSTPGEKEALARATPEQLEALWRGGQTPSMSGGGRMTIREPAGIVGLHSGRFYATLAEEAPEEVNIKSQKNTAQEQGTGGRRGTPRSFASGGDVAVDDEEDTATTPTMPPWLKTLSYGGHQQYPAANLAGLPPAPSAQYMRGMSESQFQGLQGVVEKGGGYVPDWLKYIYWLMPRGEQFARPTSMPQKY